MTADNATNDELEYTALNAKLHMMIFKKQMSCPIAVDMDKISTTSELFVRSKPAFDETTLCSDTPKGKMRIQEMNLALITESITEKELVKMYAPYYILTPKGERILADCNR